MSTAEGALLLTEPGEAVEAGAPPPWRRILNRLLHSKTAVIAGGFIVLLFVLAIFATLLQPADPQKQFFHLTHELSPQTGQIIDTRTSLKNLSPNGSHWLGTDYEGRDILSRIISGLRTTLEIAALVIAFSVAAAIPLGLIAGYFGRWIDAVISRIADAFFAFPPLMLALAVAVLAGRSILSISGGIAIVFVPGFVRIVRAQVLAIREETFITASRSIGVGDTRMLVRHVLPNVAPPLVVQAAIGFGYAVTAAAGLGALGFGPQNAVTWGDMLNNAYNHLASATWPIVPPGVAITLVVLAFNLMADVLRDAFSREVFVTAGGLVT
ncbi:MAG TPA: ABC transporter permease [Mycobacteriales bacterium]|nr:ABC transporter permease [Mycobacteriales bacterium]